MRNINPFGLRLQPDLKARLEDAARQNMRSLNAEIAARLEASFPPTEPDALPAKTREQIARIDGALYESVRDKVWRAIDEAIDEAINNSKKK